MPGNKNIFDNSAGNSLRNFEQDPPAEMWNRIQGGLKRRHRKIILFRYSSIAASLLILLSVGIYFLKEQPGTSKKQISQITVKPENDKKEAANTTDKNKSGSSAKPVISKTLPDKNQSGNENKKPSGTSVKELKPINKNDTPKTNKGTMLTPQQKSYKILNNTHISQRTEPGKLQNEATESFIREELAISEMAFLSGNFTTIESPIKPYMMLRPVDALPVLPVEAPVETSVGSWDLALGYGMTSGRDLTESEVTLESRGKSYSYDDFSAQLANQTSFFEEIDNTIHDAPIAIGLMVGKGFSKRLSIESGIVYTRLAFRIKTDDLSPFYRKYRNEMYYLGIPAGVRYSFLKKEKFNLYALQWGVLEKGIAGRWHIDTYNNNEITDTESKNQIIRGVQFSTVTALGAQYKLTGNIYLFGQGGVQVFYLNKTQPFNIRSQKVAWPSIQAGLRVDF